jgi:hypothetical protein
MTIPVTLSFAADVNLAAIGRDESAVGVRPRPAVPPPRDQFLSA